MKHLREASRWLPDVLWAGGAQAAVQLAGFVAGIIIIRCLPPQQYAWYTVAISALGVMTVLTDGGIANGVLAQGGQVWQQRGQLGAVLAAGMALRRRLGALALVVSIPLMVVLLRRQGADWAQAAMVAAATLPFFVATVTGQLLEVVPRLQQRLVTLQLTQLLSNVARIVLVGLLVSLWPVAAIALVGSALPQWWSNLRLRRVADVHADWRCDCDPQVSRRLLLQVQRTLPGAIYYSISGQLSVWLVSIFGSADGVAAVGALGRLAMVLSGVAGVFNLIAVPRFARLPESRPELVRRRYLQLQLAFAAACVVPVAGLVLFPGPILSLLGPHYTGFHSEAVLMALSYMFTSLCGLAYVLGASRGVVVAPIVSIPFCIGGQIMLICLLPLHQVAGVVWVGLLSEVSLWLLHAGYFLYRSAASIRITSSAARSRLAT